MAESTTNEGRQEPLGSSNAMDVSDRNVHFRSARRFQSYLSAWKQPALELSAVTAASASQKLLYDIAFGFRRLEMCVPRIIQQALDHRDQSLFGWDDKSYYEGLIPEELVNGLDGIFKWYTGREPQERKLRGYVEGLTTTQVRDCIRDTTTLPYLSKLFVQMTSLNQGARARQLVLDKGDYTVATDYIEQFGEGVSKTEYAEYCIKRFNETLIDTRYLYNVTLELRGHIQEAASNGVLDILSLEKLKLKMSAIDRHFHETCGELRFPERRLVFDTDPWWLEPSSPDSDKIPKNAAVAYQSSPGMNSTISFLVPVVSLLSSIPIYLAWSCSPHTPGSYLDSDFYQLLTSSAMQLLGMFTTIIPTVYHIRLAKLTWFWTWILASASTFCAIIAIPLYLYVPIEWSIAMSFMASVGQSFVTLQLMFVL